MPDKPELKIGDWVRVVMVGINDGKNEPAYQIEKIDGDGFWVSIKTKFLGALQSHDRALGHSGMRLVRKKTYKD